MFALERWNPDAEDAPCDEAGSPLPFLNVGTGIDLSIRELAEAVAQAVGYAGSIEWDTSKPDGTPKKQLDVSRLAAMGWRVISLSEGCPGPSRISESRRRRHPAQLAEAQRKLTPLFSLQGDHSTVTLLARLCG